MSCCAKMSMNYILCHFFARWLRSWTGWNQLVLLLSFSTLFCQIYHSQFSIRVPPKHSAGIILFRYILKLYIMGTYFVHIFAINLFQFFPSQSYSTNSIFKGGCNYCINSNNWLCTKCYRLNCIAALCVVSRVRFLSSFDGSKSAKTHQTTISFATSISFVIAILWTEFLPFYTACCRLFF